ncbi:MAG: sigma-70 family RNA polymerase sigma factor [Planctomycetes bacterium]|nr:sigma-70 family RNA polymerase sigma factor [Planctomycetota bacterium]MCB9912941.1 sigma-70 family RNA polymerase sigma factor [Planctomycetota bacterium]
MVRMQEIERTDEQLVLETLDGSREAFQVLVERHQSRLFGLARHYLRNSSEVEDLVQDTFLKAFSRLETFQSQSSFFTWLYRIGKNTILDHLKRKGRSPVLAMEDPEEVSGGAREGRSGRVPSPDSKLLTREVVEVTRAVLEELPDIFRDVLILRELEGLSYQEISETLDVSIGTVESRIFRARAKFKEKLIQRHPEFVEGF